MKSKRGKHDFTILNTGAASDEVLSRKRNWRAIDRIC